LRRLLFSGVAWRTVLGLHESMAFVARPRSEAVGATGNTLGAVTVPFNVGPDTPSNFGDAKEDHGGQFNRTIQRTWDYYGELATQLRISR
jgi:hypothetical protein